MPNSGKWDHLTIGSRKPTFREIEVLDLMGRGEVLHLAWADRGLSKRAAAVHVTKLRRISGRQTVPALVYWGLTEMHIHYPKQGLAKMRRDWLEVVKLLALDKTVKQIGEQLHLTRAGVESRIRYARLSVDARTQGQLVAICWSEDWIS